jgi:hypothetical protein
VNCGCCLNGIDDLLIAGAPAQVPLNGQSNFIIGRGIIFIQQRLCGDEEARCAKTTLRATMLCKARLDWCKMRPLGEAFNGED